MIILALRGTNFMKFRRLELEDIPRSGLIGVTGANEGGKSTVGDAIQFGLFGKTLSTVDGSVLDLITWDEDHCSLEIDFEVTGQQTHRYRIWREMDRYGTNFARLVDLDHRTELASGLMHVQERLKNILRFDFEDYWRSFYLAQGDPPRSPEEMAEFLDRIVGTDVLLKVREDVQSETEDFEGSFAQIQADIQRNKMQIDKYVPNVEKIPELHDVREKHADSAHRLKDEQQQVDQRLTELDRVIKSHEKLRNVIRDAPKSPASDCNARKHLDSYPAAANGYFQKCGKELERVREGLVRLSEVTSTLQGLERVETEERNMIRAFVDGDGDDHFASLERAAQADQRRAMGRANRARWAGSIFLLVAVIAGGLLWDQFEGRWVDFAALTGQTEQLVKLSLGGIAGLGLLFAVLLYWRGRRQGKQGDIAGTQIETLLAEKQSQERELERLERVNWKRLLLDEVESSLEGTDREPIQAALSKYSSATRRLKGDAQNIAGALASLADMQHGVVQKLRTEAKDLRKEKQKGAEALKKENSKRDRTDSEIREYQKQDGRREALEEQNAGLREKASEIREQIDTRMLLTQMLDETVDSIRHRAGPNLGRSMRRLLPSLTGGRYTDMQVTHDFRLRLFTSAKSDFLQSHELSGGTYEGLSIGFRLVFSQAFIKAVTRSNQFLFLDEPFKAMDRHRIHETLKILTKLSSDLSQVFVLEPEIPDKDRELFDEVLETRVASNELVHRFGAKATPRQQEGAKRRQPAKPEASAAPEPRADASKRETSQSPGPGNSPAAPAPDRFGSGVLDDPVSNAPPDIEEGRAGDDDLLIDLPDSETTQDAPRDGKAPESTRTDEAASKHGGWFLGSTDFDEDVPEED